jgi:hypothetical protein
LFPPEEVIANFKKLSWLNIEIKTGYGKKLWEKGFHTKVRDTLRLRKLGVPFFRIGIHMRHDWSAPTHEDGFWVFFTSDNHEGEEKDRERTSLDVEP